MTKPNRCTECGKLICQKSKSCLCSHCYRRSPKAKAYRKEYLKRPEVKERSKINHRNYRLRKKMREEQ